MIRRNISIGGVSITKRLRRAAEIKATLRESLKNADDAMLNRFVEYVVRSGFDMEDVESYVTQTENHVRPALEAFLFHNEHAIDQVFLNQGTYTNFGDTAQDPNYALRHKGQTELILRRLTPGDLLMLQASHLMQSRAAADHVSAEHSPTYWRDMYFAFIEVAMPHGSAPHEVDILRFSPNNAAAVAFLFAKTTRDANDTSVGDYELQRTFMDPASRFYVGLSGAESRKRFGDSYHRVWTFAKEYDREAYYMAATIVTAYAIDNLARADIERETPRPHAPPIADTFIKYLRNMPNFIIETEAEHGDQETEARAEPTSSGEQDISGRG